MASEMAKHLDSSRSGIIFPSDELGVRVPDDTLYGITLEHNPNIADRSVYAGFASDERKILQFGWQAIWNKWGETLRIHIDVPPVTKTSEEIARLEDENRMMIYIPEALSSSEQLPEIGKLFFFRDPEHCSWLRYPNRYRNLVEQHGWLHVETDTFLTTPQKITSNLVKRLRKSEKEGQTLNTYLIASLFNHLITSFYFDERDDLSQTLVPVMLNTFEENPPNIPSRVVVYTNLNIFHLSGDQMDEDARKRLNLPSGNISHTLESITTASLGESNDKIYVVRTIGV